MSNKRNFGSIFGIVYVIFFVLLAVVSLVDGAWTDVVYPILIFLLISTMLLQSVLVSKSTLERVRAGIVFGTQIALCVYLFFFGNRYWTFICVLSEFILAVLSIALYFWAVKNNKKMPSNSCVMIGIALVFLFCMLFLMDFEFVSEVYMLYILIPAGVLAAIAAVLMLGRFREFFLSFLGTMGELIALALVTFIALYMFMWVGVATANYAFDGEPVVQQYEVLDKNISSGSRQVTRYEMKVNIDGKERWVNVSRDDYKELEQGDLIKVGYYSGALGIAYYRYIPDNY